MPGYDIILSVGQSNEVGFGEGDYEYPAPDDPRIWQLGRNGGNDLQLIPATEPLEHWTEGGGIGHVVAFARLYAQEHLRGDRQVLIVPAGRGLTSITYWLSGAGYDDLIERLDLAVSFPGSRVAAASFQHGETDMDNLMSGLTYEASLHTLFDGLRARYGAFPILMGEMVPNLGAGTRARAEIERGLQNYAADNPLAVIVSSEGLSANSGNGPHFDAASQIALAERYFAAYAPFNATQQSMKDKIMRPNIFWVAKSLIRAGSYASPDGTELLPIFSANGRIVGYQTVAEAQNSGVTAGTVAASRVVVVDASKNIGSFGDVKVGGILRRSVDGPAAAGNSQGTATAITADINFVTAADGTKGVILPAHASLIGDGIIIVNTVLTAALKVYPQTGGTVGGLSANAAFTVLPGETLTFFRTSSTAWLSNGTNRIATGVLTTASATDTVVTGLRTVRACGATYETDPADANFLVSATKGDQAGSPAAGSIIVKTWKTDGTDPTPVAATSFSKNVNWWAVGN